MISIRESVLVIAAEVRGLFCLGLELLRFARSLQFVVLDFAYKNTRGHHHALNELISDAARQQGFSATIMGSRYLADGLRKGWTRAVFRSTVYHPVSDRSGFQAKATEIRSQTTLDLLLMPWRGLHSQSSVLLVHTATPWHIQALVRILHAGRVRCRIHVFLMLPPSYDVPQNLEAEQARAYLDAWQQGVHSRLNLHFWTENEALAEHYRHCGLAGVQSMCLPASHLPGALPVRAAAAAPHSTFLFIGDPREEKGFGLVLEALMLAAGRELPLRFRLRLTHLSSKHREALAAFSGPELDLQVQDFFPDEVYQFELQNADALLLPYSPAEYRIKNSNIVSESLACGTPVVVPGEANSLLRYVTSLGADCFVTMPTHSGAGLLSAMQSCIDRLPQLQQAASYVATSVRNSRSPERFIRQLSG